MANEQSAPDISLTIDHCQLCRINTNTARLLLHRNTGLLLMRIPKTIDGRFCGDCAKKLLAKVQLHNFVFGWWGTFSFIANTMNIPANFVSYRKFLKELELYSVVIST